MKFLPALVLFTLAVSAQAQTSDNNPKLKEALKRFPQADANKDGVLTLDEAKAFQEKAGKGYPNKATSDKATTDDGNTAKPEPEDDHASGIQSSYIYKTVGKSELRLFVDLPKGHTSAAKVPAIVLFHGGGFRSGSEKAFERQAAYLAERGMVALRARYRLTSQEGVQVTDCVEDALSAMRWVRANAGKLGIDPDRIAAGGGSAGGYLSAATLLIDHINAKTDPAGVSPKPNALVLFNPGFGNRETDGKPDPRDADGKGNLVSYVKPGAPPTIIFHGTADTTVPYASVEAFTAAMKKAGNRCELLGYEGATHSFFNKDKYYELTIAETDKFLTGLGWLTKSEKKP